VERSWLALALVAGVLCLVAVVAAVALVDFLLVGRDKKPPGRD
jgi:hypothetical protein